MFREGLKRVFVCSVGHASSAERVRVEITKVGYQF